MEPQRRDSAMQTDALSRNEWRKQRRESIEGKVYESVNSMLGNTSCLALGNIFLRNHSVLKTLWCIAFVACSVFTIRQLYMLSLNYFAYTTSTYMELEYSNMEFPGVTVCNLNPIRRSQYSSIARQPLKDFLSSLESLQFFNKSDNGTEIETRIRDWRIFRILMSNETVNSREQMGHQLDDFIVQCSFNGIKCDTKKLFTTITSNRYGNCFVFNSFKFFNTTTQFVTKDGNENGLILTLNIEHEEYLHNLVPSAGIRLHIHEPRSRELPELYGFSIPPGFESAVEVTQEKIIRLPAPYGNCTDGKEFEKIYKVEYTYKACMTVCRQVIVERLCGCYVVGYVVPPSNPLSQPCFSQSQLDCAVSKMQEVNVNSDNCNCLMPCRETKYHLQNSFSEWPTDQYAERLSADLGDINIKMAEYRNRSMAMKNLLNVIIYQGDTFHRVILHKPTYKWENYLSDIGGSLSLFLGFSLLTGFEFLEMIGLFITFVVAKIIYRDVNDEEPNDKTNLVTSSAFASTNTLNDKASQ